MALGDVIQINPDAYSIEVLATVSATNGGPTGFVAAENPTMSPSENGALLGPFTATLANAKITNDLVTIHWQEGAVAKSATLTYQNVIGGTNAANLSAASLNRSTGALSVTFAVSHPPDTNTITVDYYPAPGIEANLVKTQLGATPATMRVAVISTAGSGTMTATVRLWQRLGTSGWVVSKVLNAGSAIPETTADSITYSEEITTIGGADRYYLEVTAIGGTGTSVKGLLVVGRNIQS